MSHPRLHSLALILSGLATLAADTASIEGRVALPKAPPTPVVSQRYEIVNQSGVLATNPPLAVVYLEGSFPAPAEQPKAVLAQEGLAFIPSLLAVRRGTRVEFPNHDDTFHNVFSFSPAKRFDLGRYRPGDKPVPSQVFDQTGLVTLRCEIHQHMRGLVLVLDTPYFVVTDSDGSFLLPHLPPGSYILKAWLSSKTTLERPVTLGAGQEFHIDFP